MRTAHLVCQHISVSIFAVMALAGTLSLSAQSTYKIQDKWKIGGAGGWDYLVADADAHRLYITHNSRVEVVDSATGKLIGAITGLKSTHGVALAPDGKLGYISDGAGNAIVIFDRATLDMVATVPAGTNPDGIVYEPITKTVWAFNGRSKDATVLDTATQKVVATVPVPGKPEFPQADGKGNIYDNIEDKNEIIRIDATARKITAEWPICDSPSGMAIDRAGHRLFSVCDGKKMSVVDFNSGKILATPAIGDGPDAAGFDPKTGFAFSSNGEGTLTVIDAKHGYKVLQSVATQQGARTMALDPTTGKVYVVTAEFGAPPAATAANPHPRRSVVPDSFAIIVAGRE